MKKPIAMLYICCSILGIGCKTIPPTAHPHDDYARFQLANNAYLYALDTKTGQLCRTFNENPDIHIPKGLHPDKEKSIDRIPLCIDLSQDEDATIKSMRGQ